MAKNTWSIVSVSGVIYEWPYVASARLYFENAGVPLNGGVVELPVGYSVFPHGQNISWSWPHGCAGRFGSEASLNHMMLCVLLAVTNPE
jgi:hypothetical protein